MGKVVTGLIVVVGLWVGVELFTKGPSRAFDGLFAELFTSTETRPADTRSTAQRAGAAVERARDATEERRARMLGE
jgi:hypothetical protein